MGRRILFCWEIGESAGHVAPYLGLLDALGREGFEVALALKNTSVLDEPARTRFPTVFQAPLCVNEFTGIAAMPANFTEICLGFGYAHQDTLAGLVRGWRAIFSAWRPDLVLANFAPACLLAARVEGIARVRIGTGYENSPAGARLPLFTPWTPQIDARLEQAEDLALRTANAVIRECGGAPAASVSEVVAQVPTLLATIPELDRFEGRDAATTTFLGELPALRRPAASPDGEADVLAYLRLEHPAAKAVLEALARGKRRAWVYLPGASETACASLGTEALTIARTPFDLAAALPRVGVVMSYAGHGMVLSSLFAGKPMLLVPANGEQSYTARRVTEMGLGVALGAQPRSAQVAAALERCLGDEAMRARAGAFAESHVDWTADRALSLAIEACKGAVASARGLRIVGSQP